MNGLAPFETKFVQTAEYLPITSDLPIVICVVLLLIGMIVGYGIYFARIRRGLPVY